MSTIAVSVLLYSQAKKGTQTGLELKIDLALVTRSRCILSQHVQEKHYARKIVAVILTGLEFKIPLALVTGVVQEKH